MPAQMLAQARPGSTGALPDYVESAATLLKRRVLALLKDVEMTSHCLREGHFRTPAQACARASAAH